MQKDKRIEFLEKKARGLFQQLSNGKMCFHCKNIPANASHHIVYKKENKFLKWDWRNAMPICNCHIPVIHGQLGAKLVYFTDWDHYEYLQAHKNISLKQYLVENGKTEEEFLRGRISEIEFILKGEY